MDAVLNTVRRVRDVAAGLAGLAWPFKARSPHASFPGLSRFRRPTNCDLDCPATANTTTQMLPRDRDGRGSSIP